MTDALSTRPLKFNTKACTSAVNVSAQLFKLTFVPFGRFVEEKHDVLGVVDLKLLVHSLGILKAR